ncbi:MAG: hypothetical protein N3F09_04230 [Bacteroidia bacterium]|nr:hypothetical protein [Bacteroidia bacterium]
MKIKIAFTCLLILVSFFFFCKKKNENSNAIAPTYKSEATGTGANPNINNSTQTGTVPPTNPATQNSHLQVGGSGWVNPSCASTGSVVIKGINGVTEVTLTFLTPPTSGTYQVTPTIGPNNVQVTVINAPNQPAGVVWYGKTGLVTVNTTSNSINCNLTSVQCTQQNFNFPVVSVSGVVGCN